MSNGSSTSIVLAASDSYSELIEAARFWVIQAVAPPFTVFAVYGNLSAAFIFIKHSCNVPFSARFFYVILSLSDCVSVLTFHVPGIASVLFPSFREAWYSPNMNILTCVILRYAYMTCNSISAWSMVTFAIERTVVISRPMQALSLRDKNYSVYAASTLAVLFAIFFISAFFGCVIAPVPTPPYRSCTTAPNMAGMVVGFAFLVKDFIPSFAQVFCNVYLVIKLRNAAEARGKLSHSSQVQSKIALKELAVTFTLVALSLLHCVIFAPMSLLWMFITIASIDAGVRKSMRYYDVYNMGVLFLSLEALVMSTNFVVYLTRIPNFRKKYLTTCCFMNSLKGDA